MLLTALGGFFKRERSDAELMAVQAQNGDEKALEDLLVSYSPFIKKTAAQVCKRFIDEHDDEYSIALEAFHEAIKDFDQENNASFLTFAHLVVRRRVIDYIRKEGRRKEFSYDFTNQNKDDGHSNMYEESESLVRFSEKQQVEKRQEEIIQYEKLLQDFDLSFQTLTKVSPSHEDARTTAIQIAQLVAETDDYKDFLMTKKKLPVKEIEHLVKVSRKTIERNRKYIIAVALLLMSDLHYLKDYLKGRLH